MTTIKLTPIKGEKIFNCMRRLEVSAFTRYCFNCTSFGQMALIYGYRAYRNKPPLIRESHGIDTGDRINFSAYDT